jgi:hypothetical protein
MTMRVLLSGQAGIAVVFAEGATPVALRRVDSAESHCSEAELPRLFAGATDVRWIEVSSVDEARQALDLEWRKDIALHLVLLLVDREASEQARKIAARDLERLFADAPVFHFVRNRMYGCAMPARGDLGAASTFATGGSHERLTAFLADLNAHQHGIVIYRRSWDDIRDELPKPRTSCVRSARRPGCSIYSPRPRERLPVTRW